MFDAGIDWHAVQQNEYMRRFKQCPFFDEAGILLQVAAELWPGAYGGTRRANELRSLGGKMIELANYVRRSALGWIDPSTIVRNRHAPREHDRDAIGGLLGDCNYRRGYNPPGKFSKKEAPLPKSTEAARTIACLAVEMTVVGVSVIAEIDPHAQSIGEWRNELETIVESPILGDGPTKATQAALPEMIRRAYLNEAAGICSVVMHVHYRSTGWKSTPGSERWKTLMRRFRDQADDAFRAAAAVDGNASMLTALPRDITFDSTGRSDNYASKEKLERVEQAGAALIMQLSRYAANRTNETSDDRLLAPDALAALTMLSA